MVVNTYRRVFWAAGFGWMFDAMDVGLLSFIVVKLAAEWNLSASEVGWLGTANTLGMAIGASMGGWLADRWGRRPIFMYTLVLIGLASFSSAAATGFAMMLGFRFLIGLGLGAELPVASTLMNEFAPASRRGSSVVLLESFWAVGWIAAAAISYFIIPSFGWRWAVIIGGLPLFYAIVIRRNVPESPKFRKQSASSASDPKRDRPSEPATSANAAAAKPNRALLFRSYRTRTLVLWTVWFAVTFSYYGMFLWLPSVLVGKGFTMIKSFEYVLFMTLAQLPGYFLAAYLVERWGRKPTLALFMAMTALAAFLFGGAEARWLLLTSGAMLSFFNLGAWGALYAFTPENYPTAIRATGSGLASGVGRLGSIVAPLLVGWLTAAQIGYTGIFSIFTIVLGVGVVVLLRFGTETRGTAEPSDA